MFLGEETETPRMPAASLCPSPKGTSVSCPLASPCPASASVLLTLGCVSQERSSQLAQSPRSSTGVFQGGNEWVRLSGAWLLAGQPCGSAAGVGDRVGPATTLCLCPAADPPEPSAALPHAQSDKGSFWSSPGPGLPNSSVGRTGQRWDAACGVGAETLELKWHVSPFSSPSLLPDTQRPTQGGAENRPLTSPGQAGPSFSGGSSY